MDAERAKRLVFLLYVLGIVLWIASGTTISVALYIEHGLFWAMISEGVWLLITAVVCIGRADND